MYDRGENGSLVTPDLRRKGDQPRVRSSVSRKSGDQPKIRHNVMVGFEPTTFPGLGTLFRAELHEHRWGNVPLANSGGSGGNRTHIVRIKSPVHRSALPRFHCLVR